MSLRTTHSPGNVESEIHPRPRLRAKREAAAMTLSEAAYKARIDTGTVSRFERAVGNLTPDQLGRLAVNLAGLSLSFTRRCNSASASAATACMSTIFANLNRAQVGDVLYQPGPADGGVAADHFADFLRCVPLQLDGASPNRIDGAIGNLLPGLNASFEVCSIGKIAGTTRATENMAIRKHGRTTGYTEGIVTDELIDALVAMDPGDPNAVGLFQNQFRIVPSPPFPAIGKGGDSGSLVVRQDAAEAVGLYFANPSTGEYGYANHIADVLHDLEIELL